MNKRTDLLIDFKESVCSALILLKKMNKSYGLTPMAYLHDGKAVDLIEFFDGLLLGVESELIDYEEEDKKLMIN